VLDGVFNFQSEGQINSTELIRVDRLVAEGLLSHLQTEYPEFKNIENWGSLNELTIKTTLTDEMMHKINKVSHRRSFIGTCSICRTWE
jgi:hypothetical protein